MKREHGECVAKWGELPHLPDDAWSHILCQVIQQTEIVIAWHGMTTGWDDDTTRLAAAVGDHRRPRSQRWQLMMLHRVCKRWPQHVLLPGMHQLQSLEWGAAMWFLNRHYNMYRYKVSTPGMSAQPLLSLFPSLTYLDISPQWGEPQLAGEVCSTQLHQWTGLRALNLRMDTRYHEPMMTPYFQKLTNLQSLSLRGNDHISVHNITPIIPTLTELDISGALTTFDTRQITLFTNLRSLTVVENYGLRLPVLSHLTGLTRLDMRGLSRNYHSRHYLLLRPLTRLQELTLSSNDLLDGTAHDKSEMNTYIEKCVSMGIDLSIVDHLRPYPFPRPPL